MSQVVKPEVLELRARNRILPRLRDVDGLLQCRAWKDQRALRATTLVQREQQVKRVADQRHHTPLAILGFVQGDRLPGEIDLLPEQRQQLAAAHSSGNCKHDYYMEIRV